MKSALDHAQGLLHKAINDLTAAQAILGTGRALDTACFHAQQTVEKSLKALLALHDIEYPWRHDLGELLELAKPFAPELQPYEDQILNLTPFAVEIRYDVEFEPSVDQARIAFGVATAVLKLVNGIVKTASQSDMGADTEILPS